MAKGRAYDPAVPISGERFQTHVLSAFMAFIAFIRRLEPM